MPIISKMSGGVISQNEIELETIKTILILENDQSYLDHLKAMLISGLNLSEKQLMSIKSSKRLLSMA